MKRAVNLNLFKGFNIDNHGPCISHLQYADDTLCIGDASIDNLWTLKAILRGFELASGLKVNFWKSCLVGVNVSDTFMEVACSFLNSIKGSLPFKYLGLPVGANPRRISTWDPVVLSLRKKLNLWGNKHISFGGRIVLINSVLNSIPIYFLSFMKMPVQVIKITRIQREFLWGGLRGGKKLCWIKWKVVCQEKRNGGLGIRDIKAVNLSLLMKWRWRLLQSDDLGLWKEVLSAKYGSHILHIAVWPTTHSLNLASTWWRDLCDLESCVENKNWVAESFSRCLGNGAITSFWHEKWIGIVPLCVMFPRLFSLSTTKEAMIVDLVTAEEEHITWNFGWRRALFIWEEELVNNLLASLEDVTLSNREDRWWWNWDPDGFSVKSVFDVLAFSWQLLYDRVPTKENLRLRRVIPNDLVDNCVWCGDSRETSTHLFLHCKLALGVWYQIFKWLGVIIVVPPNLFHLFDCLSEAAKNGKSRKGFRLVWHSVIWCMWKARNDLIFNNVRKELLEVVEEIKIISWRWSAVRLKIPPCLYYEWCWDPGDCFNR
ncbi:hypothetical protein P8452_77351 [Trifolium repens]|nr:hypothetical protein P8452_77351 [Trifolium repens]